MKSALKLSLFFIVLIIFGDKSLSLTDYRIKQICKKEINKLNCINNLKERRSNLQKGNFIQIPVIPYKK